VAPLREIVDTWASIYANSAALRSAISFAHVGGLVGGGGCAIAADLGTLRALRQAGDAPRIEIQRLQRVHGIVTSGLALVIVSGVLLALADLDAYLESSAFWIKMALVVALLVNGAALVMVSRGVERGEAAALRRLWIVSAASLALWFLTTLMGAVLPNAL
jgi:uncharacterized membrane protein